MIERQPVAIMPTWVAEPYRLVSLREILMPDIGIYSEDEFITGPFSNLFYMLGCLDEPQHVNTPVQRYQVALMAEEAAKYMERWGLRVSASHTKDLHRTLDYS
jgi:hypothetical protein